MSAIKLRLSSFVLIIMVYVAAFTVAVLCYNLFKETGVLPATLLADITATLVVWAFGMLFHNSSLYDPYWSIAPLVIFPCWMLINGSSLKTADYIYLIAVCIWGIRLTYNWAIRWHGVKHQDWRYTMFKSKSPRLWFITNLFGINLMPTFMVFLGMIPAYFGIFSNNSTGFFAWFGFVVCMGAAMIQSVSDKQMDFFKKRSSSYGNYIDEGLWCYSRHPNYFGEISFWWGIWIIQMGIAPEHWETILGPVFITMLFVFISIPMMEKHILESRPGYKQYRARVSMLIPWFRTK